MPLDPYPRWRYYPLWRRPAPWVSEVVGVFQTAKDAIYSIDEHLKSAEVLERLSPGLEGIGFTMEGVDRLPRPVLFGDEGYTVKTFNVDGFRETDGIALEVESGGAVYNNRIILDLIKMSLAVDVRAGVIAVPLDYTTERRGWAKPYPESLKLFDAIFANPERFQVPLEGLLLLGY